MKRHVVIPALKSGAIASAIATGVLGALGTVPALAADWELNPRIEAGYLYDDNYRLDVEGNETSVTGPMLDAQMEWRALTPTSDFSLTPRVRATYFSDASELDSVDYFAGLNWLNRGERVTTRVTGQFSEIDVVSSLQADLDPGGELGEPGVGDAGRVLVDNRRQLMWLRPSFMFDVSQRRELQLSGGYTDVSFDEQVTTSQVDYNMADLALGLMTRVNERSNFIVRARGTRYDIENRPEPTNGYGAELEWNRTTAAETRSYFRLGAENVELLDGDSDIAWLAGVGVNMLMGRNELFLDLSRNVNPSAAGVLVNRDQLRVRWTHAYTPRLNLVAGLRATRDEDVESDAFATFAERTYAGADLGLEWRWQEEFSLRVAYDYALLDYKDSPTEAKSTGAMVSVTYEPLQRRR